MNKKSVIYIGISLFILGILSLFLEPIINGNKTDYLINNLISSYKTLLPRTQRPNLGINLYVNLFLYLLLLTGILVTLKTKWKRISILFISFLIMFIDNILSFISKLIYSIWYYNFEMFPLERRVLPFLQYAILIVISFKVLKFIKENNQSKFEKKNKYSFIGYTFDLFIIWIMYVKVAISIEKNFEIAFEINKILSFLLVSVIYFTVTKSLIKNTIGEIIMKSGIKN